ncbi:MAG: hypothetical protein BWX79_02115 [Alphaproteobacteria bacterium ADurb.Bin100]|nr:MAG: hypothetical protein BWX79_02115 [Alphaproteobacteria bacterium ADurb.Bin100]
MEGVRRQHDRLAHAVTFQDGVAGALLPFGEGLDQQRRRARNEQAHPLCGFSREGRLGQHAHIQRGYAHEHGGLAHAGDDGPGVEPVQPYHLAAIEQRRMNGHEQAMHVEDRQRVDEHVAPAVRPSGSRPAPVVLQHHGVGPHVAVRQHRAFAAPGGTTGVEDGSQVVVVLDSRGVAIVAAGRALQQGAGAIVAQGEHVFRARSEGDLADPAKIFRAANHHGGLGIADEILDFGALVSRVQRQEHIACAQRGEVQQHGFDRFFDLHRHPAALGQLQRGEQVGHHRRCAVKVAPRITQPGPAGIGGFDGDGVQVGGERGAQRDKKVQIAHVRSGCGLRKRVCACPGRR